LEVINLEGSFKGKAGSLGPREAQPKVTDVQASTVDLDATVKPLYLGRSSRVVGRSPPLDHVNVTTPGI